jgi:hypothetical protein
MPTSDSSMAFDVSIVGVLIKKTRTSSDWNWNWNPGS